MGWTSGYYSRSEVIKECAKDWQNEHLSCKVIAKCCSGSNLWVVFERSNKKENITYRFIALFLIRRFKDGDYAFKDMDESCGPNEVNCPLKYLDLAPSNEYNSCEFSLSWRKSVREYWENKHKAASFCKTLVCGQTIHSGSKEYIFDSLYGKSFVLGRSVENRVLYKIKKVNVSV